MRDPASPDRRSQSPKKSDKERDEEKRTWLIELLQRTQEEEGLPVTTAEELAGISTDKIVSMVNAVGQTAADRTKKRFGSK